MDKLAYQILQFSSCIENRCNNFWWHVAHAICQNSLNFLGRDTMYYYVELSGQKLGNMEQCNFVCRIASACERILLNNGFVICDRIVFGKKNWPFR